MRKHPAHAQWHAERPDACRARSPKIPVHSRSGPGGGSLRAPTSQRNPRSGRWDGAARDFPTSRTPSARRVFPSRLLPVRARASRGQAADRFAFRDGATSPWTDRPPRPAAARIGFRGQSRREDEQAATARAARPGRRKRMSAEFALPTTSPDGGVTVVAHQAGAAATGEEREATAVAPPPRLLPVHPAQDAIASAHPGSRDPPRRRRSFRAEHLSEDFTSDPHRTRRGSTGWRRTSPTRRLDPHGTERATQRSRWTRTARNADGTDGADGTVGKRIGEAGSTDSVRRIPGCPDTGPRRPRRSASRRQQDTIGHVPMSSPTNLARTPRKWPGGGAIMPRTRRRPRPPRAFSILRPSPRRSDHASESFGAPRRSCAQNHRFSTLARARSYPPDRRPPAFTTSSFKFRY